MDRLTGKPNHIEDYLIKLHSGQWFGWSDSKNKVYANLIIHDDSKSKPSESDCTNGLATLQLDFALADLRGKRTRLLAETDFYALSDVTLSDDMTTYRQAIRDLPSGKDTVKKCEDATWPTKP